MLTALSSDSTLIVPFVIRWNENNNHEYQENPMPLIDSTEARILDYWIRRKFGLSETEWTDFYSLVMPVLLRTKLSPEYVDSTARNNLATIFFSEKIFLNASTSDAGPLENIHVLHGYLKNFARDLQRKQEHYTTLPEHDLAEDEALVDPKEPEEKTFQTIVQGLADAGIEVGEAAHSADQFLGTLERGERAYLRYHTCSEEENREPISSIAKRWELGSSYHYKARQLGITRSKGETYVGYEKTAIGGWLKKVGAQLTPDWREEIAMLLLLLCQRALAMPGEER